jgi:hypothetical protein
MTTVAAVPNITRLQRHPDHRVSLFDSKGPRSTGQIGSSLAGRFVRKTGRTGSVLAWDFASLAMAVVAADRSVSRNLTSADGWTRRIDLTVGVNEPDRWRPTGPSWKRVLDFLTGDLWNVEFIAGGCQPVPRRRAPASRPEASVCLLSGGLDSLVGAIDLSAGEDNPLLVSHLVTGDSDKQVSFAKAVGRANSHIQLNGDPHTGTAPELSQRSRSLAFIACGALAGTILDRYLDGESFQLFIPENGFISLNVPLTPLRGGSLSTRTTHPIFLKALNEILDALEFRCEVVNPYGMRTKGEMLQECKDPDMLTRLAYRSMSCGHAGRPPGVKKPPHVACGRCLPCLVRRSSIFRWNGNLIGDQTTYLHPLDLRHAYTDPEFWAFDDVMQIRSALELVRAKGIDRWIGPAITSSQFSDARSYRSIAEKGLFEINSLFEAIGPP